jgi:phosphatidate cytidylyltransferase
MFGLTAVLLLMNAVFRFPITDTERHGSAEHQRPGSNLATLGMEFLCVAYLGVLLALTCQLRWLGKSEGYFALGAMVVATKMGDVGAYTFGRLIGGAKMTPKLSPGKTWSGGVGHVATAGLATIAWLCWLGPKVSPDWTTWSVMNAALFGAIVGFTGLVGDLAESLIKRDVGAKDAPVLLPGFGGLLDLMDSLLLAGPVALGMWTLLSFMR